MLIIHLVKKGYLQSLLTLYLDVTISSDLHWDKHVGAISAKAMKTLNVVRRNIYWCPPDAKALVYTFLIRPPHLEFASAAWDILPVMLTVWIKYSVELLGLLKVIIVSDLGWQPLTQRRKNARLHLFYKGIHGLAVVPVDTFRHPILTVIF